MSDAARDKYYRMVTYVWEKVSRDSAIANFFFSVSYECVPIHMSSIFYGIRAGKYTMICHWGEGNGQTWMEEEIRKRKETGRSEKKKIREVLSMFVYSRTVLKSTTRRWTLSIFIERLQYWTAALRVNGNVRISWVDGARSEKVWNFGYISRQHEDLYLRNLRLPVKAVLWQSGIRYDRARNVFCRSRR